MELFKDGLIADPLTKVRCRYLGLGSLEDFYNGRSPLFTRDIEWGLPIAIT